ncbi:MAG: bifunctional adenosylcobinamide kinase/adenosylcobinamide-phosphate guanylyltransferase [Desulfobacterales bacterium]|nr:bifunctional adenosylcobinamide kinase/adenosylcobinamide-phosphate guanylyltransferase [Desulfobacterales bacterium]
MITLIIGGCRSGKSAEALRRAEAHDALRRIFVATCRPYDAEMRARIERHRRERDARWETLEVPLELADALEAHDADGHVILVDCLTLWATNLLMDGQSENDVEAQTATLVRTLAQMRCPVILVANEVGQGIVPENAMARRFRDWAGMINQKVAAGADQVVWMVAGIAVKIK